MGRARRRRWRRRRLRDAAEVRARRGGSRSWRGPSSQRAAVPRRRRRRRARTRTRGRRPRRTCDRRDGAQRTRWVRGGRVGDR
eukprot:5388525-Pleurochrysis_carterae.AAC.1